jgi:DNA-binding Xre family transcriptional regulator
MLSQRNMTLEQLVSEGVITAREAEKIRSNGNMNLSVIDGLCKRLQCQPADVVMFI